MIEGIDHVNLVVRDLEGMIRFYSEVLLMKVSRRATISGDWVDRVVGLSGVEAEVVYMESAGGSHLELIRYVRPVAVRPPGLDRANTPGLRHVAFRVRGIDDVLETLKSAGVEPLGAIQDVPVSQVEYGGSVRKRLVYFLDPEQNLLEVCEYTEEASR